jgi:hypothetical protein
MEYGGTSHNRSVYAAPAYGGLGLHSARSVASLLPTPHYGTFGRAVFASQSPFMPAQTS